MPVFTFLFDGGLDCRGLLRFFREYYHINNFMGVMNMWNLLFAFIFALLVAIFAVQNSLPVTVSFLAWSFQTSLVIIILGSAMFGALTILSLSMLVQFRLRRTLKKTQQSQQLLTAENAELRASQAPGQTQNQANSE